MAKPLVSIVIPSYNEKDNIPLLIQRLEVVLKDISHEIIVVDDNSPDGTWQVAEELTKEIPHLRVIRRLRERGLSSAVLAGMSASAGQTLAVLDADLQHDEGILPQMIKTVTEEGYDVAIGSRGVEGGSYGDFSRRRRFISWVAATMAKILLPINVRDPMSGFFLISRDVFINNGDKINPLGFKILLEFIGRSRGIKIKEVPYTFRLREHGETKLSGNVIRNYLIALYDLKFGRYIPTQFALYSLVGASGVVVNLGGMLFGKMIGIPSIATGWSPPFDTLHVAQLFGIQLSIITNYVLNNYLTFYEYRHRGMQNIRGFLLFQTVSSVGLLVQFGIYHFLQNYDFLASLSYEDLQQTANNMIGIIVALVTNYYLNVNITWQ